MMFRREAMLSISCLSALVHSGLESSPDSESGLWMQHVHHG
jgi:hypothetical protein